MEPFTRHSLRWRIGLCCLLIWGTVFIMGAPVEAELYNLIELGTLGGDGSVATGINNAGQIVGYASTTGDGAQQAFLYSNGTMTSLGTLGGTASQTFGINNVGQVVGESTTVGNGAPHAFLYSIVMDQFWTLIACWPPTERG